jgi:hypothetical protein
MIEYYKNLSLSNLPYINEEGLICWEEFRDIPEYEGLYQVSDLGRVKALQREVLHKTGVTHIKGIRVLKQANNGKDYLSVLLYNLDSKKKSFYVHRLALKTFKGNSDLLVDHKNHIRLCNILSNLQYLTPRLNSSTVVNRPTPASMFIGVTKSTNKFKKWRVYIRINGKKQFVGSYYTEKEASDGYQKAVDNWDTYNMTPKGELIERNPVKIYNTKSGENLGVNTKIILDNNTGIFYESLKEACFRLNLNYKYTSSLLCKRWYDKISLIYV